MSIQIKPLADALGVNVTLIKSFLKESGFAKGGRDFRGAETTLTRGEERAVREAHREGRLKRNRGETIDVATAAQAPEPCATSDDLAGLPAVEVSAESLQVRGDGRYPILLHAELLEWLADPATPPALRRICTRRIQELMAHGRATRMKGVRGKNGGWLRTPVGGNAGAQFYLWLMNHGEVVHAQVEESKALHAHGGVGARYLRAVRHHDETRDPIDVGACSEYAPLRAQTIASAEDGLADPLVEAQHAIVSDRRRVRILVGQPGAGKTTSLQAAASRLAGRALYVTWSPDLADRAKEWFAAFAPADLDVIVWTFRELLARVDPNRPLPPEHSLPDAVDRLCETLAPIRGQLGPWHRGGGVRCEELFTEMHAHVVGAAVPVSFRGRRACDVPRLHDDDYRRMRSGIGESATDGAIVAMERLGERAIERLFAGPVAAFARARALTRGELTLDPEVFDFDWVLVDEVQDLTLVEQWLLVDVAARAGASRGVTPGMIVAGDEAQTVRPTAFEFGPLSELIDARLGARTERAQHDLVQNLRSPESVARLLERARRVLYRKLPRQERPRGRYEDSPADVTAGRVLEVAAAGDDLRQVFEVFAALPGDGALVYPGAIVPPRYQELAREAGTVVWTSETIKGLELRVVAVLDVPARTSAIEALAASAERDPLAVERARGAIDKLLVALSRSTETLVLIGDDWAQRPGVLAEILGPDPEDEHHGDGHGHLGVVDVGHLHTLLDADGADAIVQIDALLTQSAQLTTLGDHEGAARLAENAAGLLGRSGRPGSAGRDLRKRAHRRVGQTKVRLALLAADAATMARAARAFRDADAKEVAALVTALGGALFKSTADPDACKRLLDVAQRLGALGDIEPALEEPVLHALRERCERVLRSAQLPCEPAGRAALVRALELLAAKAPSSRDAFAAAHQAILDRILGELATQPARRTEYADLRGALADGTRRSELDALHAESCGDLRKAASGYEALTRIGDALRCYRAAGDLESGARVAASLGASDAEVIGWAAELARLLGGRPEGALLPDEVAVLRNLFDDAFPDARVTPSKRRAPLRRRASTDS